MFTKQGERDQRDDDDEPGQFRLKATDLNKTRNSKKCFSTWFLLCSTSCRLLLHIGYAEAPSSYKAVTSEEKKRGPVWGEGVSENEL